MTKFKTLKDHVYEYIAEEIFEGNLKTNEKIDESVICNELSISRTPVREALIQLAGDGILENVPRKGYVVKGLTLKDAGELYCVIGKLDGMAASLALPNMNEKDFKDMQFYIDSMDIAIKSEHYEMYNKQQLEFHEKYICKCNNSLLISELNRLKYRLMNKPFSDSDSDEISRVMLKTNREHQEILRLFISGKPTELEKYISETHWSISNAVYDLVD